MKLQSTISPLFSPSVKYIKGIKKLEPSDGEWLAYIPLYQQALTTFRLLIKYQQYCSIGQTHQMSLHNTYIIIYEGQRMKLHGWCKIAVLFYLLRNFHIKCLLQFGKWNYWPNELPRTNIFSPAHGYK